MNKKLLTALLLALLFALLFTGSAMAADLTIDDAWIAGNAGVATYDLGLGGHVAGDVITIDASEPVTLTGGAPQDVSVVCTAGTDLVLANATLDCEILVPAVCALSFTGADNTLECVGANFAISGIAQPGIHAGSGTELTILGSGRLVAVAGPTEDAGPTIHNSGAAIGGGANEDGGTITIDMDDLGYIEAYADYDGSSEGAGIGGGSKGSGGTLYFYGGTIDAYGFHAAGIGGGGDYWQVADGGAAGNITFDGAEIHGYGYGFGGAGIGSGPFCMDNSSSIITIESGYVYGLSEFGTGIGGGFLSDGGAIRIRGGEVIGESSNSIGIGSAFNAASGGSITIEDNALVFAYGDGTSPDIAHALDTFSIRDSAEVFTAYGIFGTAPTTSHTVEPGNEVAGPDLTGVGAAYGFSDPDWPGPWEEEGTYGWFVSRIAVNPQTGDSADNTGLIYGMAGMLLALGSFVCLRKKSKS